MIDLFFGLLYIAGVICSFVDVCVIQEQKIIQYQSVMFISLKKLRTILMRYIILQANIYIILSNLIKGLYNHLRCRLHMFHFYSKIMTIS